jgi:CRISPR/Cas system CSM-associated protein Csm5 (group 7 of RAMP superfamily)
LIKDFRIESIHKIQGEQNRKKKNQGEHFPSTYTSQIQYQRQLPGLKFIDHFQVYEASFIATKESDRTISEEGGQCCQQADALEYIPHVSIRTLKNLVFPCTTEVTSRARL